MTHFTLPVLSRLLCALALSVALASVAVVVPTVSQDPGKALAAKKGPGKKGKREDGKGNEKGEDRGRGHEHKDNRGKGKGAKEKHKENEGKGKGGNAGATREEPPVVRLAVLFQVQVDCDYAATQDVSTCTFTPKPEGESAAVLRVVVPADVVCAEPGPTLAADGGVSGVARLALRGKVIAAGEATYWVVSESGVFPATGPSLACEAPTSLASFGTPTPIPDVPETSGSIVVQAFDCGEARPAAGDDWFAVCTEPAGARTFSVQPEGATANGAARIATTDDDGRAEFARLEPGNYELTERSGAWCHAESDRVDERGLLTVVAGERTTVWIFHCDGDAPTATT